ncbi:uncharacterized protein LOC131577903 [Poecile atricapillus]|uniref:uncharacterized protein LOC131577903 n=1 Tax=Poecile atricapillus TaxID=48891 RepID=UPI0027389419|nr:uncharacterized protein LOC131577903 [Poecile atricapillus]
MTNIMEFSLSEVINSLINNRPSPALSSYCLLLKKLLRYQKDRKRAQREHEAEKDSINSDKQQNKESETKISQKAEMDTLENLGNYGSREFPTVLTLAMQNAIQEDEITVVLENQENLSKVSKFAGRELVSCGPPESSRKSMPFEPIYQPRLDSQNNQNDFEDLTEARKPCLHEKYPFTTANKQSPFSNIQAMTSTSKILPWSLVKNRITTSSPLPRQDRRFKHLLKTVYDNIHIPTQRQLDKDGADLLMINCPQQSPFPRLQQATLRETLPRKISLLGTTQEPADTCPLVTANGSKPPILPMPQQQKFIIRNMKQFKENPTHFFNNQTKKNLIQLRHIPTITDVNLPVLCPPYQTRLGEKREILRLNFA